ncbi:hypothetical protein CENSYa_0790 [Cenarchaeum symbiosum A]|uniref:Uncharacterized protein n=1 Tax=Cenarchaeum symbiosum (strain A) TaxID=414004 RepID=A0RVQ6_CENSY|nr:hypothetical protein CENSYa_0790 [Cenarchaeum symbiosum A]
MELTVHVNNIHGSQMAAKLSGRFVLKGETFRFTAIAFGRIGGQNVGAKLSKATVKRLESLGHDTEEVILELQKNLLQGDLTIPEGVTRETFVDD